MHPVAADAPAGVLAWRDRPSAVLASLTDSARPDAVRHRERSFGLGKPDRAESCYRQAQASRAEVVQVRRADPRADLCLLLSAHTSWTHRTSLMANRAVRPPAIAVNLDGDLDVQKAGVAACSPNCRCCCHRPVRPRALKTFLAPC